MTVELNHTIVHADDPAAEAAFFAEKFDLPPVRTFGPFLVVEFAHGLTFDFLRGEGYDHQHYAFLVSEDEFTEIFGRIVDRGIDHWADPGRSRPSEINHRDGGRGVYFPSPGGHLLEIITRPYGSGG
jgi:catechol 2,3-dioxygenase-like lactoylglutathione lyase family enzyme